MRHAEAVDDRFVALTHGIVAGVHSGGRAGFAGKADRDAHGALDTRSEE